MIAEIFYLLLSSSPATAGTIPKSDFSVTQVANPSYTGYATSGQAALEKAYAKYGKSMPGYIAGAVNATKENFKDHGTIPTQPQIYDSAYLASVAVGSPAQNLFLDFDTGSSDLWVFSTELPPAQINRQKLYNPGASKTAKQLSGATWSIRYGDQSTAGGDVYIDKVNVGGVVVNSQAVEAAQTVSGSFTRNSANSGLLGLGWSSINNVRPNKQSTFFDNVKGVLSAPLFTADLKSGEFGSYDFGYIDDKKKTGDITYTDVNTARGYWTITSSGYAVGDNGTFVDSSIVGIVDTGTTLLLLPDLVIQAYYHSVEGSTFSTEEGGWIFPCNDVIIPDFVFGIGSYRGTIPGSYLSYAPITSQYGYCFGGIQSNVGIGFSIFGDVLIKSQFVVFDGGNARVGFAPKTLTNVIPNPS